MDEGMILADEQSGDELKSLLIQVLQDVAPSEVPRFERFGDPFLRSGIVPGPRRGTRCAPEPWRSSRGTAGEKRMSNVASSNSRCNENGGWPS